MTRVRRPWFELDDDRVVVVRLIVGLEPDLSELFLDDAAREKRSRETLCKLVIMTMDMSMSPRGSQNRWSSHGVVIYERNMDVLPGEFEQNFIAHNIIGLVPGPEQIENMTFKVNIDWVAKVYGEYRTNMFDRFFRNYSLFAAVTHLGLEFGGVYCKYPWLFAWGSLSVVACFVWFGYQEGRYFRIKMDRRKSMRELYPCTRTSWELQVGPSKYCDITPFLWNETMFPRAISVYAKFSITRKGEWWRRFFRKSSNVDLNHPTMPRLLCSNMPFAHHYRSFKTTDGIIIRDDIRHYRGNNHIHYETLPDIHEMNKAVWRRKRMLEFKNSPLKKEIIETAWHPLRIMKGLVSIDE